MVKMRELRKNNKQPSSSEPDNRNGSKTNRQPNSRTGAHRSSEKSGGNTTKGKKSKRSSKTVPQTKRTNKILTSAKKGNRSTYDWESTYKKVITHLESSSSCSHSMEDLVSLANTKLCPNYTRNKLSDILIEKYGQNSIRIQIHGRSKKRFLCLGRRNCRCLDGKL